jgi:tetratricopeptide (TPR) repeat protein
MDGDMPLRKLLCLLVTLAVLESAAQPGRAETPQPPPANAAEADNGARLTALFARLGVSNDELEGETIVDEIWRVWLQSGHPEIDAMLQKSMELLNAGEAQAALVELDAIVARAPEWPEGWNKRATVLYLLGEYDRSLADIERALALEPRHFGALAGRGLIHIARENYGAALDDYRRARAVNPFLKGAADLIPTLERKAGQRPL